ncbi:MAG: TRAP transporter substrate-binding protein [Spirochaetales bacterium]|nr:TRAP transporter substrate-binding protein [Spirochaetales bacterium]
MRKVMIVGLCLFVAGIVFAGGSGEAAPESVNLRYGNSYPPDHPSNIASAKFADLVKERTGGKVTVSLFPGGQLGGDRDQAEGTIMGTQEMVLIGTGGISQFSPILGIGECPFIWRDVEHMGKVLDSDVGKELTADLLKTRGLRILEFFYYGTRHLTANKPVRSPADMQGFKLRTPQVPVLVAMAKSWGAEPTPMDISELYLSLKTNVVDGQENPIPTIDGFKFYEAQGYLILTGHVRTPSPLIINERVFQGLSGEYQGAITASARDARNLNDTLTIEAENKLLDAMKNFGMQIIEPDVEAFRKATGVVPPQFESVWGKDLYERIVNTR